MYEVDPEFTNDIKLMLRINSVKALLMKFLIFSCMVIWRQKF